MSKPVSMEAYREATDQYLGWCPECGDFTTACCEPDAQNRECDCCGDTDVTGAEDALVAGLFYVD